MPSRENPSGSWVCETCRDSTDHGTRAALHCGWMAREEWAPAPLEIPPLGGQPYTLPECPGWVVRQPGVTEGCQAYSALKAGALALYYPRSENAILEAAMAAQQAFQRREAEELRAMEER